MLQPDCTFAKVGYQFQTVRDPTIVVPRCWNFVHPLDAFLFEEGIADRHLVYQPDLGIAVNSNGKFLRAPVTDGLSTDLRTRI